MKDELGERMKEQYENRTRFSLPRRTYTIIRLDGKAFHTYTRGLVKPFDHNLYTDIDNSIVAMMPEIQGAVFAYTQSDEISILLTDFALPTTSAWFDGNIQKIASVSASVMTAQFNTNRFVRFVLDHPESIKGFSLAFFDSRVFTIPDRIEVMNYFIWRNQDCSRNSVSMLAQWIFSHKQLQGKSTAEMIKMTEEYESGAFQWGSLNQDLKFGRLIVKRPHMAYCEYTKNHVERKEWAVEPAWKFTEDKEQLLAMIPKYE